MWKQKKIFRAFILSILLVNLLMAFNAPTAYAQTPSPYKQYNSGVDKQIAQFLCAPSDASQDRTAAQGDLYNCINKLYRFALVIAVMFATFFIVIAGYIYMAAEGNEESVTRAKDILTTSIASIVILSIGYILLRFLNPDLIKFQPIQPPSVVGSSGYNFGGLSAEQLAGLSKIGVTPASLSASSSEQDARAFLLKNNINVNAQPPQTILAGIKQSTLNTVVSLKQACGSGCGQIVVTGGTEPGHSETGTCNHSSGNKIDLGVTSGLDAFIMKYTYIGVRAGDGAKQYKDPNGIIYARETSPPHWDISVCVATAQPTSSSTTITPSTTFTCPATACSQYSSQIAAAAAQISLPASIDKAKVLSTIMYHESRCQIGVSSTASTPSCGLMQLQPATANTFKSQCGAGSETITCDWLKNPANAQKSICMAGKLLEYLSSSSRCGSDLTNILIGYAGGQGVCADKSKMTGETRTAVGEFLACINKPTAYSPPPHSP